MTHLEKKLRDRERNAINAVNKTASDLDEVYNGAIRVLFDLAILLIGIVIGFYLSESRAEASTSVSVPPRAEYVGVIPTEALQAQEPPQTVNETAASTMPNAIMVERVGEPHEEWESLGVWKTTGFCPCRKCNGRNAGRTASGAPMTPGRTVAVGHLPFGTVLKIGGHEYVVEDRGVHGNHVDILYGDHRTAYRHGVQYLEVFIKKGE